MNMQPLVDVRDTQTLSAALSQVFLLVEKINAQAFHAAYEEAFRLPEEKIHQTPSLSMQVQNVGKRVLRSGWGWGQFSTLPMLMKRAEVIPKVPNPEVIGAAVTLLSGLDLRLSTGTEELWETARFHTGLGGGTTFSTAAIDGHLKPAREIPIRYYEEPFDPISAVQLFLEKVLGEEGRAGDHYLQRWLRTVFGLTYDKETKYALAAVCERFNRLFYGSAIPSSQEIHTRRPATFGTSLLIAEILQILDPRRAQEEIFSWEDVQPDFLRQAIGIYLFIRFCRQVRCRYFWLPIRGLKEDVPRQPVDCQCVSALRPLAYTYFQARLFGRISAVPGLSNIFRGGMLPRTRNGTTVTLLGPPGVGKTVLAIQLMADVARFGGLAVYCSFEESYDSIVDRLVTFGQYQPDKFLVEQAEADLEQVVRRAQERDPLKGLLVLLNLGGSAPRSLSETIQSIADSTASFPGERALAIDSISALGLRESEGITDSLSPLRRINLHALIDSIENSRFWGLLLGEDGDANAMTLAYLVDTVLRFSFDEAIHTRWIEISKCRLQDFQSGRHPFRIADGRGVVIYPSLVARRSSLRRRVKSTLSEHRLIPFPGTWRQDLALAGVFQKSSSLLWGPPGGKTLLLLHLLTATSLELPDETTYHDGQDIEVWNKARDLGPPRNVLLVTFRTTEINLLQALRHKPGLYQAWERIGRRRIRWYSPGENITGDQLVTELWKYIKQSRREGVPIERIAFDETEAAEEFLPTLKLEPLFWPTLLDMTSTEAATTFFVFGRDDPRSRLMEMLRSSVDYVFRMGRREDPASPRTIEVEKQPSLEFGQHRTALMVNPAEP